MRLAKKTAAAVLCLALCFIFIPKSVKAATLQVTLSEDTFLNPDTVNATLTIHNDSAYPMTDISVTAGGTDYSCGNTVIAPGAKENITLNDVYVSSEYIGKDMEFLLKWNENGFAKSTSAYFHINDANNPDPSAAPTLSPEELIDFTCYVDNPHVEKGAEVKVSYKVVNDSSLNMTDITIMDKELSSVPVVSGGNVAAGKTAYFSYKYTMGDENTECSPIMTYSLDGEIKSLRGNSITLESVTVNMSVNVVRLDPNDSGTEFIIKIANNGNKPITGITVYKGESDKIEGPFELETSESKEISYIEKPKGKAEVSFKITGRLATGEEYKYTSDTYTVWEYIDPNAVGLKFSAEVTRAIDKEGYVTIDFTAQNTGTLDMSDIFIEEESMGRIGNFSNLTGGGEETVSLTLYIGEAKDMNFTLTGHAPTGEPYTYKQRISSQKISFGNGDGTTSGFNASTMDVGGAVSKLFKKVLIVLAIITALAGAGLITLSVFEHKQNLLLKGKDGITQ